MKRFTHLHHALDTAPFHRDKSAMLAEYFAKSSNEDAAWALFLMMGGQLETSIPPSLLKEWMFEETGFSEWLLKACQEQVGELTETIMLLGDLSKPHGEEGLGSPLSLHQWIESQVLPLQEKTVAAQREAIRGWWKTLPLSESSFTHHLVTGRYQTAVSRRLIEDALCLVTCRSREVISARLSDFPLASLRLPSTYTALTSKT